MFTKPSLGHRHPTISRRSLLTSTIAGVAASILAACGSSQPAAPTATNATNPTPAPAATAAPTTAPPATISTTTSGAAPMSAPTMTTAGTMTAQGSAQAAPQVDWAVASKPYAGHTVNVMTSAGPWGKGNLAAVDDFTKLTGIKIAMDNIPEGDGYIAKEQSVLLGGGGSYDTVAIPFGDLATYVKGGVLQEISAYLNSATLPKFDMSDYAPNVINIFMKRNDKFYGIPASDGVQIMYYRKDLFDAAGLKPPTTWQEVYDAAKKLKQGDVAGVAWDAKGIYAFNRMLNLLPKELPTVDKDYRLTAFRDPQTIANVDIWQKLYKEGLAPQDTLANDLVATYAVFQSGKAAMQPLGWIVGVAQMEDPMQSKVAGKVGYAPVPGLGPSLGGWSYVIPTAAKEKEAAYIFINWLASRDVAAKQVTEQGNFDDVFHSTIFTDQFNQAISKRPSGDNELMALRVADQSHATARPSPLDLPEWSKVGPAIAPIIQKIIAGELTARDGMNQAADTGEKILADAGYYKK